MNIIKLSAVTLLLTSSLAIAGGDIEPVEPSIITPDIEEPAPTLSSFYAGLGYSCLNMMLDTPDWEATAWTAISATAGYNFNPFLAIEARYTASLGDINNKTWDTDIDKSWDMSNLGIYIKPQYSMDRFKVYGLIGYGQTTFDNGTSYAENSIQYGGGLSAMVIDNVDVYVDYRRLYDDNDFDGFAPGQDAAVNSFTVGANYSF